MGRRPIIPAELTRGPFTLEEARAAGLRQLRGRAWRRLTPTVWVWSGLRESPLVTLSAALRRLPPGAAFSGRTAAWLHGLDVPPCDPIEASVPRAAGVSGRAGISLRKADIDPADLTVRQGLPATSITRTLSDLAATRPLVEAVIAADLALHAGRTSVSDLHAAAARGSRTAAARLRRVIELAEPLSESPMETRLRLLLVLGGLPRPLAQVVLRNPRGAFLGRADLYYPGSRVAIEYDGRGHLRSLTEDSRRQNGLLNAGYRLLRFTASDVLGTPETVLATVRGALSSPRAA